MSDVPRVHADDPGATHSEAEGCHELESMEIAEQARENGNAITVSPMAVSDGADNDAEWQEALPRVDVVLRGITKLGGRLMIAPNEV